MWINADNNLRDAIEQGIVPEILEIPAVVIFYPPANIS
jgi:hypothetical protein